MSCRGEPGVPPFLFSAFEVHKRTSEGRSAFLDPVVAGEPPRYSPEILGLPGSDDLMDCASVLYVYFVVCFPSLFFTFRALFLHHHFRTTRVSYAPGRRQVRLASCDGHVDRLSDCHASGRARGEKTTIFTSAYAWQRLTM